MTTSSSLRGKTSFGLVFGGCIAVLVLILATVGAPPAYAQTETRGEATARFRRGTELYKEESYEAALVEFRRAYELSDEYRVLYNIAQVCYQLHDYVCALRSFESYLERGGEDVRADRKREVQGELARLKTRVGTFTPRVNVPGADVTIDNVPRGKTPLTQPVMLSAGQHSVTVSMPGKVPVTRTVDLGGGENQAMTFELLDASTVVYRERPGETPSKWTTLSYLGLAGAGALAVGAGVTGILALDASHDVTKQSYVGAPSDDAESVRSRMVTLRTVSDVLTLSAVAVLATTLVLTLTREPAPRPARAASLDFTIAPTEARLLGTF
jgi:hypothetical protein